MSGTQKQYLTTRLLKSKSKKAFSEASKKAMLDHGYIVIAKDGQIIKQFKDGSIEVLEEIVMSKVKFSVD